MSHKGLNKESVIKAACAFVTKYGYRELSIRNLAKELDVQPPALYNHISGIQELTVAVGKEAAIMLHHALADSARGMERDDAIRAMCNAYREFVNENRELYMAFIFLPHEPDNPVGKLTALSLLPLKGVLQQYEISNDERTHTLRALRAAIHGFSWFESDGLMRRNPMTRDESYEKLIEIFLQYIKSLEKDAAPEA